MTKMTKEFDYKGFKFYISVYLQASTEKHNGNIIRPYIKFYHIIKSECFISDKVFTKKDEIETSKIEEYVNIHEKEMKDSIDEFLQVKNYEEDLLLHLGFIKVES